MNDARARCVVLPLRDPHRREGVQRRQDGAADPHRVLPLGVQSAGDTKAQSASDAKRKRRKAQAAQSARGAKNARDAKRLRANTPGREQRKIAKALAQKNKDRKERKASKTPGRKSARSAKRPNTKSQRRERKRRNRATCAAVDQRFGRNGLCPAVERRPARRCGREATGAAPRASPYQLLAITSYRDYCVMLATTTTSPSTTTTTSASTSTSTRTRTRTTSYH